MLNVVQYVCLIPLIVVKVRSFNQEWGIKFLSLALELECIKIAHPYLGSNVESTGFWLPAGKLPGSAWGAWESKDPKEKCLHKIFSFLFCLRENEEYFQFYFSLFPIASFSLVFYLGPKMDFWLESQHGEKAYSAETAVWCPSRLQKKV